MEKTYYNVCYKNANMEGELEISRDESRTIGYTHELTGF